MNHGPQNQPDRIVTATGYQGVTTPFFLLYARRSENAAAEVLADEAFHRAYITYRRLRREHVVTTAELASLLRHANVTVGVNDSALAVLAERVNLGKPPPGPFQVAAGQPPIKGEDESVEFYVRPTSNEARYETANDGAIDYRQLNLVQNGYAGQLIAAMHPAREGRPGKDIHSRPLEAEAGGPCGVTAGEGVELAPNGREFRSLLDGRVVFDGATISMSTHYEIPGDVDFRVGNVDFVGTVQVRGSVLDGFTVRGREGVRIVGGVEGCTVESRKDIEIVGGVKGRGVARIVAGGSVKARYLDECIVEAGGDVEVGKEIINASIRATRRVLAPRATFVGGDVVAFQGVHLGTVGSALGVGSRIGAGINWTDEETLERLDKSIAERCERAEGFIRELAPFLGDKARQGRLTMAERALVSDLAAELSRLREETAVMLHDRDALSAKQRKGCVMRLNVATRAYPGVLVRFPNNRNYRVTEERRGPFAVTVDEYGRLNKNDSMVALPAKDPFEDGGPGSTGMTGVISVTLTPGSGAAPLLPTPDADSEGATPSG